MHKSSNGYNEIVIATFPSNVVVNEPSFRDVLANGS